jgi:hypothetical protein
VAAAVGQQPLERGDLHLHGLGPEFRLRRAPLRRRAPLGCGTLPLFARLRRGLSRGFPFLLGRQPRGLNRLLLACTLGLFLLLTLLRGPLRKLAAVRAVLSRPLPAGPRLLLLPLQLRLLMGRVQLGDQRLTSGHQHLRRSKSGPFSQ